mmetsp:Transcript_18392/g.46677  ORF Transcript_18392/g.46677 Transcript_18392/m.46677 type:complete len:208 (+) Transcript_18392:255-878(+)
MSALTVVNSSLKRQSAASYSSLSAINSSSGKLGLRPERWPSSAREYLSNSNAARCSSSNLPIVMALPLTVMRAIHFLSRACQDTPRNLEVDLYLERCRARGIPIPLRAASPSRSSVELVARIHCTSAAVVSPPSTAGVSSARSGGASNSSAAAAACSFSSAAEWATLAPTGSGALPSVASEAVRVVSGAASAAPRSRSKSAAALAEG